MPAIVLIKGLHPAAVPKRQTLPHESPQSPDHRRQSPPTLAAPPDVDRPAGRGEIRPADHPGGGRRRGRRGFRRRSCAPATRPPMPAPAARCAIGCASLPSATRAVTATPCCAAANSSAERPFLHLVGDHLHVAHGASAAPGSSSTWRRAEDAPVSAVQPTHESLLTAYGTVGGRLVGGEPPAVPDRDRAGKTHADRRRAAAAGAGTAGGPLPLLLRHARPAGRDLRSARGTAAGAPDQPFGLSPALHALAARRRYLAFNVAGRRYDIGAPTACCSPSWPSPSPAATATGPGAARGTPRHPLAR